jgi:hypothetical protein
MPSVLPAVSSVDLVSGFWRWVCPSFFVYFVCLCWLLIVALIGCWLLVVCFLCLQWASWDYSSGSWGEFMVTRISFQCTACSLVFGLGGYIRTYFLLLADLCACSLVLGLTSCVSTHFLLLGYFCALCDLLCSFAAPCVYSIIVDVENMVLCFFLVGVTICFWSCENIVLSV